MTGSLLRSPHFRLYAGAALISLSPVWVRLADVSPTTSGFYRVAFGAAALLLYMLLSGQALKMSMRLWGLLLVAAVFFALDLWFWHRSIHFIGPGLSTLLANFQVFFMMLAGVLLLGQRPHAMQLIAVPLALAGLLLIVGFDWQGLPSDYKWGVAFGLATAVSYTGYLLTLRLSRQQAKHAVPAREVAVVSVVTALLLSVSAFVEGESLDIPTLTDAAWLISYGVFSHALGWILITSSLPQVLPTEAGIALLLQPTLSFVWDVLLFARPMSALELFGAAIALFAIFLGARQKN